MQSKLSENEEEYLPADDTFFIAQHLEDVSGSSALEIGTGSGYISNILEKKFSTVVATDINFHQLKTNHFGLQNLVCCDGAEPIRGKFDFIVCNMPYLPSDKITDVTTDGGAEGIEIPLHIIKSAKNCLRDEGRFFYLTSSLANYTKLISRTQELGLKTKILGTKKLFFEELVLIEARLGI